MYPPPASLSSLLLRNFASSFGNQPVAPIAFDPTLQTVGGALGFSSDYSGQTSADSAEFPPPPLLQQQQQQQQLYPNLITNCSSLSDKTSCLTALAHNATLADLWAMTTPLVGYASQYSLPLTIFLALLAGVTAVVTVLGNMLVLVAFLLDRQIRQPGNYFIASLAVTDFLIGLFSMPLYTMYLLLGFRWPLGTWVCDLWLSLDYTVCLTSQYTVFFITLDRFCSVSYPARYRAWRTEKKLKIMVLLTWILPAAIFYVSIIGWPYFVGERTVPYNMCYVQFMENPLFNTALVISYYWTTLVVITVLYVGIYRIALEMARKSQAKRRLAENIIQTAESGAPRSNVASQGGPSNMKTVTSGDTAIGSPTTAFATTEMEALSHVPGSSSGQGSTAVMQQAATPNLSGPSNQRLYSSSAQQRQQVTPNSRSSKAGRQSRNSSDRKNSQQSEDTPSDSDHQTPKRAFNRSLRPDANRTSAAAAAGRKSTLGPPVPANNHSETSLTHESEGPGGRRTSSSGFSGESPASSHPNKSSPAKRPSIGWFRLKLVTQVFRRMRAGSSAASRSSTPAIQVEQVPLVESKPNQQTKLSSLIPQSGASPVVATKPNKLAFDPSDFGGIYLGPTAERFLAKAQQQQETTKKAEDAQERPEKPEPETILEESLLKSPPTPSQQHLQDSNAETKTVAVDMESCPSGSPGGLSQIQTHSVSLRVPHTATERGEVASQPSGNLSRQSSRTSAGLPDLDSGATTNDDVTLPPELRPSTGTTGEEYLRNNIASSTSNSRRSSSLMNTDDAKQPPFENGKEIFLDHHVIEDLMENLESTRPSSSASSNYDNIIAEAQTHQSGRGSKLSKSITKSSSTSSRALTGGTASTSSVPHSYSSSITNSPQSSTLSSVRSKTRSRPGSVLQPEKQSVATQVEKAEIRALDRENFQRAIKPPKLDIVIRAPPEALCGIRWADSESVLSFNSQDTLRVLPEFLDDISSVMSSSTTTGSFSLCSNVSTSAAGNRDEASSPVWIRRNSGHRMSTLHCLHALPEQGVATFGQVPRYPAGEYPFLPPPPPPPPPSHYLPPSLDDLQETVLGPSPGSFHKIFNKPAATALSKTRGPPPPAGWGSRRLKMYNKHFQHLLGVEQLQVSVIPAHPDEDSQSNRSASPAPQTTKQNGSVKLSEDTPNHGRKTPISSQGTPSRPKTPTTLQVCDLTEQMIIPRSDTACSRNSQISQKKRGKTPPPSESNTGSHTATSEEPSVPGIAEPLFATAGQHVDLLLVSKKEAIQIEEFEASKAQTAAESEERSEIQQRDTIKELPMKRQLSLNPRAMQRHYSTPHAGCQDVRLSQFQPKVGGSVSVVPSGGLATPTRGRRFMTDVKHLFSRNPVRRLTQGTLLSSEEPTAKADKNRRRSMRKTENRATKALRTITFILGAFVLTWTPYHILAIIKGFCNECVDDGLYSISYWLCYVASPLNPFCYAFANKQFKKAFLRILRCDFRSY